MKKLLATIFALGAFSFGTVNAAVITDTTAGIYDGTNVGAVDTFMVATDLLNSGEQTETDWVNSIIGGNGVTYEVKNEPVPYYNTDTTDVYAFSIEATTDYYLVKNSTTTALFMNLVEFDWGVFNITQIKDADDNVIDMNLGGDDPLIISHVTEFSGGGDRGCTDETCPPAVPVPPAVWLFGSGLLGLVGVARRKV